MIILALISFFVALFAHLYFDFNRWKQHRPIDHSKKWRTVLWVALLVPSIYFFTAAHSGSWLWVLANVLLMEFFIYVFLYDGLYNSWRHFDWWFTGSDDGNQDAVTDSFWRSIGKGWTQMIKISGMIVTTVVYIVTLLL